MIDYSSGRHTLQAAVSPCPNDSYIFGPWILGMIGDIPGHRTRFIWEDVQTLNEQAASGAGDIIKVSAAQALKLESDWSILSSGGAFGLGHGPKLVVLKGVKSKPRTIAVPGMMTTAFTLLRASLVSDFQASPMPFDRIPEAVINREVDSGLLIHETALMHDRLGLEILLDLGAWWKDKSSGLPLPLGVIIIRKNLGNGLKCQAEAKIRQSLTMAAKCRKDIQPLIRNLARELDEKVINRHIQAYVNKFSHDMGETGKQALSLLRQMS